MEQIKNETIMGRDISRPIDHIELDGVEYPLAFDNACMRVAEDVYELQYGRGMMNFADIVRQLGAGKLGAIMAVLYGALLSGATTPSGAARHLPQGGTTPSGAARHLPQGGRQGEGVMTWGEFSDKFRLTSIPGVQALLMKNLQQALPKTEGQEGENPQTARE